MIALLLSLLIQTHAAVVDTSTPQDSAFHPEVDLYDFNGVQRGTAANPLYFKSYLLGGQTLANSMSVGIATDQFSLLSTAALQTAGNAILTSILNSTPPLSYSAKQVTGNTSVQVKTGAGVLHVVVIGNNASGGTLAAYDGTSTAGAVLVAVNAGSPTGGLLSTTGNPGASSIGPIDIKFTTGLYVTTVNSTNNYFTVVYY